MAAIPPFHEDPPVGTNNVAPAPSPDQDPNARDLPPASAAEQSSSLPADWSPVTPATDEETSAPSPADTPR